MSDVATLVQKQTYQRQGRVACNPALPHYPEMGRLRGAQYALAAILAGGCSNGPVVPVADSKISVNVSSNFSGSEWIVTVRNQFGSASDTIFAVNDHRRSNIYLTPARQLVVIEQGGGDAFFALPDDSPPEALTERRERERDTESQRWRYLGVIKGDVFYPDLAECIALLGEGSSEYRRQYQAPSFC
ncbi:hypothetical protein [Sphingomonas sp. ABOLH]|uniref:hypothetical protein n=1 Tax=Sphingomonas sp. ABOLH TaxID=1985881 RepID=UPI0013E013FC|nr:hypothetical protein [Sphingomonas sp. ABOLH]